jgi:hypothetical protein
MMSDPDGNGGMAPKLCAEAGKTTVSYPEGVLLEWTTCVEREAVPSQNGPTKTRISQA